MRSFMFFCIALNVAASLGCAGKNVDTTPRVHKKDEPIVRVRAPRNMFMKPSNSGGVRPVRVPLRISMARLNEEYWCRFIEIRWGDDTTSEYDQDCFPFDEVSEAKQRETKYFDFHHWYKMRGTYDIKVYLRASRRGRVIIMISQKLQLR